MLGFEAVESELQGALSVFRGKNCMETSKEVEMYVAGLVLDPSSNAPIVILKDADGDVCLPIWIGLAEATSIASAPFEG